MSNDVLKLSNILISNHDLKNFQELLELVQVFAPVSYTHLTLPTTPHV